MILDPFFPEPMGSIQSTRSSPWLEWIKNDASEYALLGRSRLNNWLRYWNFEETDILKRLSSPIDNQRQGAVAEIYANALFQYLGWTVKRSDSSAKSNKFPDFKISKGGQSFYLEVTHIESETNNPEIKNWESILQVINEIENDDFFIYLNCDQWNNQTPSLNQIKIYAINYLKKFQYELVPDEITFPNPFSEKFEISGWSFEIGLLKKKNRGKSQVLVALSQKPQNIYITDKEDLKTKIERKRKRYGNLNFPYILMIVEDTFMGRSDSFHREGALYGSLAVRIKPNGSSETVRLDDGVWNREKPDEYLSAVLLLSRLDPEQPHFDSPQLWVNPFNYDEELFPKFIFAQWHSIEGLPIQMSEDLEWRKRPTMNVPKIGVCNLY